MRGFETIITPDKINKDNADSVMESIIFTMGMCDGTLDNSLLCMLAAMRCGIDAIRELREIKRGESK